MKTEDLISALAVDLPPAAPRALERRLALFMIPAAALALLGVTFWLGFRPDLIPAVQGPVFWAKAAYTAVAGIAGFWLLDRLGRPGVSARGPLILLILLLTTAAAAAGIELIQAPAAARMDLVMGRSAQVCPPNILGLSLLAAPCIFFAARRFAPVRPMAAGAAAGLLTAALAATLYGLHCPERTAAFVAVWYTLGMAAAAGVGALVGRLALRW